MGWEGEGRGWDGEGEGRGGEGNREAGYIWDTPEHTIQSHQDTTMRHTCIHSHAPHTHLLIHIQLEPGSCQDLLLHTLDGAETQHPHLVLLTDAMSAILRLEILTTQEGWGEARIGHAHKDGMLHHIRLKELQQSNE